MMRISFWLVFGVLVTACATEMIVRPTAEATYLGQQLKCVDDYQTRDAIDKCREDVRKRWSVGEYAMDGGKDR